MKYPKLVFSAISIVLIMELFDTVALSPILPTIAADLHVGPRYLKLAITIYIITMGLFIPISRWLSDFFGMQKTIMLSLCGFVCFSILAGFSRNSAQLIFFRAFQGFFAAFMVPIIRLTMIQIYDDIVEVMAKLTLLAMLAPLLGAILSGALATWLSWRFVFFINLPMGLIAFLILWRCFPEIKDIQKKITFDWIGFLSFGGVIACFFFMSNILILDDFTLLFKIILAAVILILLTVYLISFHKIKQPMLNIGLLKEKLFRTNILLIFMSKLSLYWIFFSWPIYLFEIRKLSTFACALMMTSVPIGAMLSKFFGKKLLIMLSYRKVLYGTLICLAVLQLASGFIIFQFNSAVWFTVLLMLGFMLGTFQLANNVLSYSVVTQQNLSSCNIITILFSQLGSAFSISFAVIIYRLVQTKKGLFYFEVFSDTAYFSRFAVSATLLLVLAILAYRLPKYIDQSVRK